MEYLGKSPSRIAHNVKCTQPKKVRWKHS